MFGDEGGMIFGGIFMWIFWILLFVLAVIVIRTLFGSTSGSGSLSEESPLNILKKRYARGEIDDEEFERRRRELEQ